jgi:hypothetical protein
MESPSGMMLTVATGRGGFGAGSSASDPQATAIPRKAVMTAVRQADHRWAWQASIVLTLHVTGICFSKTLGKTRGEGLARLRSLSRQGLLTDLSFSAFPQSDDVILVLDPNEGAHDDRKNKKFLSLLIDNRHHGKQSECGECAAGRIAPDRDRPEPNHQQQGSDRR